jgi:hypothetical protein
VGGLPEASEQVQRQLLQRVPDERAGGSYIEDPPPRRAEKQEPDEDLDDRAPGLAHHCRCSLLGPLKV